MCKKFCCSLKYYSWLFSSHDTDILTFYPSISNDHNVNGTLHHNLPPFLSFSYSSHYNNFFIVYYNNIDTFCDFVPYVQCDMFNTQTIGRPWNKCFSLICGSFWWLNILLRTKEEWLSHKPAAGIMQTCCACHCTENQEEGFCRCQQFSYPIENISHWREYSDTQSQMSCGNDLKQ